MAISEAATGVGARAAVPGASPRPWRVAIVVGSLGAGGAEGVVARLANEWARRGDAVSVLTLADVTDDFHAIAPQVTRIGLALAGESSSRAGALRANLRRLRALRAALRNAHPDLVLGFVDRTNVLTLLATAGTGLPVVVCERTDPRHHVLGQPWRALRRVLYPRATALVVQHAGLRSWAEGLCGPARVLVLPNPVALESLADRTSPSGATAQDEPHGRAGLGPGRGRIVGVGRLSPEKGFDRLVEAFARIADRLPDWDLLLTGDGPERARLETIVAERGLAGRARIRAALPDPWTGARPGDVFVLPSLYEGMSNALLEAMAAGLAPVVTPRGGGSHDVIVDGVSGVVAESGEASALATAIARVASDAALRAALSEGARRAAARFATPRVAEEWRTLLVPLAARGASGDAASAPAPARHPHP